MEAFNSKTPEEVRRPTKGQMTSGLNTGDVLSREPQSSTPGGLTLYSGAQRVKLRLKPPGVWHIFKKIPRRFLDFRIRVGAAFPRCPSNPTRGGGPRCIQSRQHPLPSLHLLYQACGIVGKRMVWTPSLIWKMKSEVCVAYSTPSAVLYSLVSSSFDPSSSSSSVQVRLCSVAAPVTIAHNLDDFNLYVFADNVDVLFGRDGAH